VEDRPALDDLRERACRQPHLFELALLAARRVAIRPSEEWDVRVDGYNLVTSFDKTLSKRNYYFRLSEFEVQPAAVSLSLRYRF
jgi:hypothetical protein